MDKKIIFLMGVSGSGKTTLTTELLKTYSNLILVPSYTTRPMRENERNGRKYWHVSDEKFQEMIKNWELLEYALVHNKFYYGTRLSEIEKAFEKWLIPIKELDINWLQQVIQDDKWLNFVSIFLDLPDDKMVERIKFRGNVFQEEIDRRLASAQTERVKAKEICDYIIDASRTVKENLKKLNEIFEKIL